MAPKVKPSVENAVPRDADLKRLQREYELALERNTQNAVVMWRFVVLTLFAYAAILVGALPRCSVVVQRVGAIVARRASSVGSRLVSVQRVARAIPAPLHLVSIPLT